ncbi:hypothetical protein GCM10020001_042500 [Nonomuraea salmonea]
MRLDRARPSGSRTVGGAEDLDGQVEVGDHAADERELLGVLLPEDREVGLHQVEQLEHDRQHAVEVPRARGPLDDAAHLAGGDGDLAVGRIHVIGGGVEDNLDAFGPAHVQIGIECTGIARKKSSLGPNCRGLTKMLTTT